MLVASIRLFTNSSCFFYSVSLVSSYNSNRFNCLGELQSKVCNESSVSN